ncbi:hypothetical protein E2C01_062487 [Portunus trituberculatus]|uniref:Uncharacterized protein n=1 Tax=Portunus trituberculatus TaxID=210409 RepID=A0A5B7HEU1_PORTR|nr:hypothetical protein [Portunus trituberculatus]
MKETRAKQDKTQEISEHSISLYPFCVPASRRGGGRQLAHPSIRQQEFSAIILRAISRYVESPSRWRLSDEHTIFLKGCPPRVPPPCIRHPPSLAIASPPWNICH